MASAAHFTLKTNAFLIALSYLVFAQHPTVVAYQSHDCVVTMSIFHQRMQNLTYHLIHVGDGCKKNMLNCSLQLQIKIQSATEGETRQTASVLALIYALFF